VRAESLSNLRGRGGAGRQKKTPEKKTQDSTVKNVKYYRKSTMKRGRGGQAGGKKLKNRNRKVGPRSHRARGRFLGGPVRVNTRPEGENRKVKKDCENHVTDQGSEEPHKQKKAKNETPRVNAG